MNENTETNDLRPFQCHKAVRAMKIGGVEDAAENGFGRYFWLLGVEADQGRRVKVDAEYAKRHLDDGSGPEGEPGGYYVRYADGYESWSPAEAFENGYMEIQTSDEAQEPTNQTKREAYSPAQEVEVFQSNVTCRKCGGTFAHSLHIGPWYALDSGRHAPKERIKRTCGQCGYEWYQLPLDHQRQVP